MNCCWHWFRHHLVRPALVGAVILGASSFAWAQDTTPDSGEGRPVPGSPPGTSDVAEGVGGVTVAPPVADSPGTTAVGMPVNLNCGPLTPLMMAALTAGMLLLHVPGKRDR